MCTCSRGEGIQSWTSGVFHPIFLYEVCKVLLNQKLASSGIHAAWLASNFSGSTCLSLLFNPRLQSHGLAGGLSFLCSYSLSNLFRPFFPHYPLLFCLEDIFPCWISFCILVCLKSSLTLLMLNHLLLLTTTTIQCIPPCNFHLVLNIFMVFL